MARLKLQTFGDNTTLSQPLPYESSECVAIVLTVMKRRKENKGNAW